MSSRFEEVATQIMMMAIVIAVILLILGVGMIVIIHICMVGVAFRRGLGRSPGSLDRTNSGNKSNMSKFDLQKLPCFDFIAKDTESNSPVDCAVCLENFKVGEKCRLLPLCGHSFHTECVDSWLLRNPICPICRTNADSGKSGLVLGEKRSDSNEIGVGLRETQSREDDHLDEIRIDIRYNQVREGGIVIDHSGHEFRENQTNLVGNHSSLAIESTST